MKKWCIILATLCLLFYGCAAFAGDVPPITAADFLADQKEIHWLWKLVLTTFIGDGILYLLMTIRKYVNEYFVEKKMRWEQTIFDFAIHGVIQVMQNGTASAKLKAAGGKLTVEDGKALLSEAIKVATLYAKDNGVDLVKAIGKDYMSTYFERVYSAARTDLPGVLVPLPELRP